MSSLPNLLIFRDRGWSEASSSLFAENASWDDLNDHLTANGYTRVEMIGGEDSLHVDIWEHQAVVETTISTHWLAIYSMSDSWHPIKIERLQDLVDFIAHVSTSLLAAVLPSDADMLIHDLCERTPRRKNKRLRDVERKQEQKQTAEQKPQVGDDGEGEELPS